MEVKQIAEAAPLTFKENKTKIDKIPKDYLILRPIIAGICGSDLHYYLGQKDPEKLKKRLPLVLLHEGIVEDIKTKKKYIVNPLIPCKKCPACQNAAENYCEGAKFMASTAQGLAQSLFIYPKERLVEMPKNIPIELATLSEPISVAFHAISKANITPNKKVVVIGDGPIGFFVVSLISHDKKVKKENLFWIGRNNQKLIMAQKIATQINLKEPSTLKKIESLKNNVDVVFEAVGGNASEETIGQALELTRPQAKIVVLGITDLKTPIQISSLINKGISIIGSSRNSQKELKKVVMLMAEKSFQKTLSQIINPKKFKVSSALDLKKAFDFASNKETIGRVLINFDFNE